PAASRAPLHGGQPAPEPSRRSRTRLRQRGDRGPLEGLRCREGHEDAARTGRLHAPGPARQVGIPKETAMTAAGALYYDPLFLGHETLDHPERPARVASALRLLEESGVADRLARPACRDASEEELLRIHDRRHAERMRHAGAAGPVLLLPDTVANTGTYAAAVRAAGACVAAVEAVVRGDCGWAYCLTRPPGHHATATSPMGFCFFNNVAIAAAHARAALGLERV